MTPNPDLLKKLTKARATLIIEQPFYGTLALRLKLQAMDDAMCAALKARGLKPQAAVDGKTIYYYEPFVEKLSVPQLRTVLAHEVGHCVFEHIGRRGSRNPNKWNMAGDYVINDFLNDAKFEAVDGWLLDAQYKGMTADQIYNQLPDQPGGQPLCDIMDGTSDPADKAQQHNEWQVATIQAANAAKQQGKLPANLERFINDMTTPKVDWRSQLRRFVTERSKDDYSWMRPNRRLAGQGIYLPGMYSETMGEIVVFVDTSGSVTQEILNAFAAEVSAVRDAVMPRKIYVVYCDAEVNHVDEFTMEDIFKMAPHGGGGTDFRPPFKWVDKKGLAPVCGLYLTDMYGTFPKAPPDYPFMWVATTDVQAPWGETIRIEV